MGFRLSVLALPGKWSIDQLVRLQVCGTEQLGEIEVDEALYPSERPSVIEVGGYTCVFWFGFYERFVTGKEDPELEQRLLESIANNSAYYFGLVSTVNLYALIAWQNGKRIRRLMGWSEELNSDDGPPLPQELSERARFRVELVDGLPRFHDKKTREVLTHDEVGESFVLAATAAVFGGPLDRSEVLDELPEKFPEYETWEEHRARIKG